jgi:hypothetical protein
MMVLDSTIVNVAAAMIMTVIVPKWLAAAGR